MSAQHPQTLPVARPADVVAVQAAIASMAYWQRPAAPAAPARPDLTPLQLMYAYYD